MAPINSFIPLASLDDLAWAIDRDGISAHIPEIHHVAVTARTVGVRPVLAGVLLDDTKPAPVRERAFGLVAISLARATRGAHLPCAA